MQDHRDYTTSDPELPRFTVRHLLALTFALVIWLVASRLLWEHPLAWWIVCGWAPALVFALAMGCIPITVYWFCIGTGRVISQVVTSLKKR